MACVTLVRYVRCVGNHCRVTQAHQVLPPQPPPLTTAQIAVRIPRKTELSTDARDAARLRSVRLGIRRTAARQHDWMKNNAAPTDANLTEEQRAEVEASMAAANTNVGAARKLATDHEHHTAAKRVAGTDDGASTATGGAGAGAGAGAAGPDAGKSAKEIAAEMEARRLREAVFGNAGAFSVRSYASLTTEREDSSWKSNYTTQPLYRGKLKYHKATITAIQLQLPLMVTGDFTGHMVRQHARAVMPSPRSYMVAQPHMLCQVLWDMLDGLPLRSVHLESQLPVQAIQFNARAIMVADQGGAVEVRSHTDTQTHTSSARFCVLTHTRAHFRSMTFCWATRRLPFAHIMKQRPQARNAMCDCCLRSLMTTT